MSQDSLNGLSRHVLEFARERDWEQFHTPKNLACALTVEAGELLEHFQWIEGGEPPADKRQQITDEIGDVLIYLVRLSDVLGIDPVTAASQKLAKNALKYPVDRAKGNAKKYTEL